MYSRFAPRTAAEVFSTSARASAISGCEPKASCMHAHAGNYRAPCAHTGLLAARGKPRRVRHRCDTSNEI